MTEKKADPAYIITESKIRQLTDHAINPYYHEDHPDLWDDVRSRPHNPAPERVMLCFGDYWECPIDEEECNVSDPCHRKAIRDREHAEQVKREAREEVLKIVAENKNEVIARLSEPFSEEVVKEMQRIVMLHSGESLRSEVRL